MINEFEREFTFLLTTDYVNNNKKKEHANISNVSNPKRMVNIKEEKKGNGERIPRSNPALGRLVLISENKI